jgi:hypothetical protein
MLQLVGTTDSSRLYPSQASRNIVVRPPWDRHAHDHFTAVPGADLSTPSGMPRESDMVARGRSDGEGLRVAEIHRHLLAQFVDRLNDHADAHHVDARHRGRQGSVARRAGVSLPA